MKRSLCTIILVITLLVVPSAGAAPVAAPSEPSATTLSAGDIAIVGFNYDDPDEFAFVLLVNITSGAEIKFTDNGWRATGVFRTGEGFLTWTAPSDLCAGTIVKPTPSPMLFSTSGDQILAYQGADSSPIFIYALNSEGTGWQADATSSNTSALPTGLTNGVTAVAIDEIDNGVYTGTTTGTRAALLALISDKANWTVSDTVRQTMPAGPFVVTDAPACGTDNVPTVATTTPANGATGVLQNADITVAFSEPVTVTGAWFDITCTTSLAHTAAVTGGPTTYTLNPDVDFSSDESCSATVYAAQVADQDGTPDNMAADYVWSFATVAADPCSQPYTHTYQIQGSGAAAAITGTVTTQGVVVGDYELPTGSGQIRGFYLQDLTGDSDPATSDGLFIYDGGVDNVAVGQVVRVTGTAGEFQEQTQVTSSAIVQCGATGSVTPVDVSLPFPAADYPERFEGMLVRLPQTLYVTEHFQLGRFGQVVVTSNADRLQQPTHVALPGAPALAVQAANNLDRLIIDDDTNVENPDPIQFGRSGNPLSASNTLRGGDSVTGIVGALVYGWAGASASGNAYRVRPLAALNGVVNFQPTNARPATPGAMGGRLRVAAGNLLNYFNTFGAGACTNGVGGTATDCRGADDATEFDRQWPKTVANLVGGGADIIDLMELENDGYGAASAIQDLVNRLNDATAPGAYAFIDVDARTSQVNALGTDAIKVGLIYKPAKVTPVGVTAALNTTAFVNGGDGVARNRPALAQAFEEVSTGARFVVCVNHFKSKGSACDTPDAGDGQGNCNGVRTNAANALTAWLASDPTGVSDADILITGDLNAYAKEDPITAIIGAGYADLIANRIGQAAYSYAFDGQWGYMDHALATSSLAAQVAGIVEWHVNADEPSALDYNTNFKSAGQQVSLYAADEFRSSDHDPIIIGLDLCFAAAAPTGLAAARPLGTANVSLTWNSVFGAATYRVWRGDTPYFTPSGQPLATVSSPSHTDENALCDPATNYFYVITAVNACGDASSVSNRVGEFDFALTPGQ